MSTRFPDQMCCPDCGLTVAGNIQKNQLRAHTRKAIDAGRSDAKCAQPPPGTRRAEEQEAAEHRRASAPRRTEWWQQQEREPTVTSEGTAQPLQNKIR